MDQIQISFEFFCDVVYTTILIVVYAKDDVYMGFFVVPNTCIHIRSLVQG